MPRQPHNKAFLTLLTAICFAVAMPMFCSAQPIIPSSDEELSRRLASVADLLDAEDWDRAIDLLEAVQISGADRVVRVNDRLLLNATEYARFLLTQLPAVAMERYRERFEPRAENWWTQAQESQDITFLNSILNEAFLTRTAEKAIHALAERALQAGQYSEAWSLWQLLIPTGQQGALLVRYPDPQTPVSETMAKLVVCRILSGEHQRAQFELSVFSEQFPDATGQLAGREGKWTELLHQLLSESKSESLPGRIQEPLVPVDLGAPYWSLPLNDKEGPQKFNGLNFHPHIWQDMVFWNTGQEIMGYHLKTGLAAWISDVPQSAKNWREQGRLFPTQIDPFDFRPDRPLHGHTAESLTISAGRLYARQAGPVTAYTSGETRLQSSRLVCLDLAQREGQLVWDFDAGQLDRQLRIEGAPVVSEDRLWVLARRGIAPSELHLLCFNAESGQYLWSRLVCSNSVRAPEGANYASQLQIAFDSGQLYITTELGCVAAFEAVSGRPLWYQIYARTPGARQAHTTPRRSPGIIVREGMVFAAPGDSDQIFALEQFTGATVWSQACPADHQLLGVAQSRVFLSGKSLIALHLSDGLKEWKFSSQAAELQGQGEGIVTPDAVWWPTASELMVFEAASGQLKRRINLLQKYDIQGGNLIGHPDGLIISGPHRVTAISPWGQKTD